MNRLDDLQPIGWVEEELRKILDLRNSPNPIVYTREELFRIQDLLRTSFANNDMSKVREILAFGFHALNAQGLRITLRNLESNVPKTSIQDLYDIQEQGL